MSRVIVLDAGPLGLLCASPSKKGLAKDCKTWLANLARNSCRVLIPEITDYEVRRELIRAGLTGSIHRLDNLTLAFDYLALTTAAMRKAAELWAMARQSGHPTASDKALDADVILAAQALLLNDPNAIIATTNVGHLSRYVPAENWQMITCS